MPNWLNVRPSWQLDDPTTEYTKAFQVANEVRLAPLKYQQAKNALAQQTIDLANAGLQNQRATMQIKSEMEAMPYKLDALKQEDKMRQNALDLESARRDGASMLFDFAASNSKKLGTWEYSDGLSKLAKDNRLLLLTSEFQDLWKQNEAAKTRARVLGIGDPSQPGATPQPGTGTKLTKTWTDPITKEHYSWTPKTESNVSKLIDELNSARSSGDTEREDALKAALKKATSDTSETIEVGTDEFGKPITRITKGGTGSKTQDGLTTGVETDAQKRIMRYGDSIREMASLSKDIRPKDVGIAGVVGEEVFDRVLSQLNPSVGDPKRMAIRERINLFQAGVKREISETGRFSVPEREQIEQALVSTKWNESHQRSKVALYIMQKIFASRARFDANLVKTDTPEWAKPVEDLLSDLTERKITPVGFSNVLKDYKTGLGIVDEVKTAFKSGRLTRDQAVRILGDYTTDEDARLYQEIQGAR